jgi:hypothetical protein
MLYDDMYSSDDPLPYVKDAWLPSEVELTAPEGAVTAIITFTCTRNIGVYIDDVQVLSQNTVPAKQYQLIMGFEDITKNRDDADFELSATASSGLPVSYRVSSTSIVSITGSMVHINTGGTVTITARQGGNDEYYAAPPVTITLKINKSDLTIVGLSDITKTLGDPDFTLSSVKTSIGTSVNCEIYPQTVAIVAGVTVKIVGTGIATIRAFVPTNASYNAVQATAMLIVTSPDKQNQTIIGLPEAMTKMLGDADFELPATASSGLAVTYSINSSFGQAQVAAILLEDGKTVHIERAGTASITVTQQGDATYNPVAVTVMLTVDKRSQTISGLSDTTKRLGDPDFELTGEASSGLAVTYSSSNTEVATINGNTVHLVGVGTTTLTATQSGNSEYNAAPTVTVELTVNPTLRQEQTITGLLGMTKTVGDPDFELTAEASSGLPVSYSCANPAIAIISGDTVHLVGAGTTTITAAQPGNDEYNAAQSVTVVLMVNPAQIVRQAQTITGLSNMTKTLGDADFTLSATASSGLAVSYSSSNPAVATISGNTVHLVGAGTTTLTATQSGNDEYNAASAVTVVLTVSIVSGVGEVKAQLPVRIENGRLIVTAASGSRIEVFSLAGSLLRSEVSAGGETILSGLPKKQVLIVRSGGAVAKVIIL